MLAHVGGGGKQPRGDLARPARAEKGQLARLEKARDPGFGASPVVGVERGREASRRLGRRSGPAGAARRCSISIKRAGPPELVHEAVAPARRDRQGVEQRAEQAEIAAADLEAA